MTKKIAIITVHGMGDTNPDYHKELEKKLRKYIGKTFWDEHVHLESVYYQKHLQGNQEEYWNEINEEYSLKWDFLRKFMLFSFSDAASIEHSLRDNLVLYKKVHAEIAHAFDRSLEALGNNLKPVIVISHSLGCEQISNYLWDAGVGKRYFADDEGTELQKTFRRMLSCHSLYTTGCNIPIFRAGMENPQLFKQPNSNFHWHNYFDPHDVLAYPLKNMADSYNVEWIQDKKVEVGGLLSGWNPTSHGEYWTDKDVIKPISEAIKLMLSGNE